jgi:hypothetical protein
VAGTGIGVSAATGAVTITNNGVTSLANGGGITASASTGAVTLGSTATSVNTASAIVARDASGNFGAGTITATLTGAATTAGTVTTAAQGNITSVGILTSLTTSGTITSTAATALSMNLAGTANANLIYAQSGDNDQFRIYVGATATNAGFVEFATADDGTEPIYVRQYTGVFTTLTRTATLLDSSGNTSFPVSVTAPTFVGALTGAATTAGTVTTAAQGNITSVGTLTSLNSSGTITAPAFTANSGVFTGNGNGLSSIVGANVTGTVANATYAVSANTAVYISTTDLPSSASNLFPVFSLGSGVGQTLYQDTAGLIYKPSTNTLYTTNFVGTLTGNASSATMVQVNVLVSGTQYVLLGSVGAGVGQTPMTYSTLVYTSSNNTMVTNINGSITTNTITTGSNVTAGTITGNWSLSAGSKLNATYADLAEKYVSDAQYVPGTVLVFGGNFEVTKANSFDSSAVAGVVSTNPAYLMNSACNGEFTVELALIGRVPVNVCGPVTKGDLMVTGPNGHAVSNNMARAGTVIGKSLENFTGEFGTIEIVVGKT